MNEGSGKPVGQSIDFTITFDELVKKAQQAAAAVPIPQEFETRMLGPKDLSKEELKAVQNIANAEGLNLGDYIISEIIEGDYKGEVWFCTKEGSWIQIRKRAQITEDA